ncbi:hypothetical protein ACQPZJ_01770 [Actinoplanes sp. CA-054009]
MTWADILTRWRTVEADLHQVYGIDLDEPGLLRRRTWRWLEGKILGLLDTKSRLSRALAPEPEQPQVPGVPRP